MTAIHTDNMETLHNALKRIGILEAENKGLRIRCDCLEEALNGANRVIRMVRDRDSHLSPLDPAYEPGNLGT